MAMASKDRRGKREELGKTMKGRVSDMAEEKGVPVRVPKPALDRAFVMYANIKQGTISQQDVLKEALDFFVEHYPEHTAKSTLGKTGTDNR